MNYELVKELKDAGFPFELMQMSGATRAYKHADGTVFAMPTLEELIKACGDNLIAIEWMVEGKRLDGCKAVGFVSTLDSFPTGITAATPSEAVARLWLALNGDTLKS